MISKGDIFLDKDTASRIANQTKWQKIYDGSYVFRKQLDKTFYVDMEQLIPIGQTISAINSSLLFGEFPGFDFGDEEINENVIDALPNDFQSDISSACEMVSAVGEMYLYFYVKDGQTKWRWFSPINIKVIKDDKENITAYQYFAIDTTYKGYDKAKYNVKEWTIEGTLVINDYVVLVNKDGTVFSVDKTNEEKTNLSVLPFLKIENMMDKVNLYGRSDYKGLEQLFAEIDNRIDQINSVLNEHADPWIGLPAGVLDHNGNFRRENGKTYEISSLAGGQSIQIAQWDARLDGAFECVDRMIEMVLFTSRISPALAGYQKGGVADSGRALKWRSIPTYSMVNTKRRYWEDFFYSFFDMLNIIESGLNLPMEDFKVIWYDGLPQDTTEDVQNVTQLVNSGVMSKLTGIKKTQELKNEEANIELGQIELEAQKGAEIQASSNAIVV
jgi:hypothetical protein